MRVDLGQWTEATGWQFAEAGAAAQLVLYFASPLAFRNMSWWTDLRSMFPLAKLVGCSTGGEIVGGEVQDDSVVAAAIHFIRSRIELRSVGIAAGGNSYVAGRDLGAQLPPEGLRGVFVLSDGTQVNGSDLVRGLTAVLPASTILTGGLAGDGAAFQATRVGADREPEPGAIVAVGFYGACLQIRHGSVGGWDAFGPERKISRSAGNILYELDGQPALDLYKRYLGDEAAHLPGSALLFPLRVKANRDGAPDVVRTVVGIDEREKAMVFAGDVPEGSMAQLMRGNFEHLIDGAGMAARRAGGESDGSLAILVSCIGRKLLMGQRIVEEVEAVTKVLGPGCSAIGFYSYGEISPHDFTGSCELHNQTMTITILREGDLA